MTIPKQKISREELYNLVWAEPMLKVGAKFGVSSSYLARICAMLNVPRPERGYWAKLVVGKAPPVPALPDARPGDETHWTPGGGVTYVEPQSQIEKRPASSQVAPMRRRLKTHPLVVGAKPLFEAGTTARDSEYLKPAKKLLVDLVVTREGLDKALGFANELFCALEAAGHHVVIAPHSEHFQRPEVDEREAPPRRNDGYRFDRPWRLSASRLSTSERLPSG